MVQLAEDIRLVGPKKQEVLNILQAFALVGGRYSLQSFKDLAQQLYFGGSSSLIHSLLRKRRILCFYLPLKGENHHYIITTFSDSEAAHPTARNTALNCISGDINDGPECKMILQIVYASSLQSNPFTGAKTIMLEQMPYGVYGKPNGNGYFSCLMPSMCREELYLYCYQTTTHVIVLRRVKHLTMDFKQP